MENLKQILKNIKTNQSDFFEYFDEHDGEFEIILNYLDENQYGWCVYYHAITDKFIYIEQDENDAEVYEVRKIAELIYDVNNDIKCGDYMMHTIFKNDCCGEQVTFDDIRYLWFKKVK